MHNFNKYITLCFNEITSIDSKFDTTEKFYNDFERFNNVKSKNNETVARKMIVLNNAMLHNDLIGIYKYE